MRHRQAALVIVMVLLSLVPINSSGLDEDGPIDVIMTFPSKDYRVGSDITLNVSVFVGGALRDPDQVSVTFGSGWRELPLVHVSEGKFTSSTEILQEDPTIASQLYFKARASIGPGDVTADTHLQYLNIPSDFDIDILVPDVADQYPSAGQTIEFNILTSYLGERVDATDLTAWYSEQFLLQSDLAVERESKGDYRGEFTIPANWTDGRRLFIGVDASYKNGTVDESDSLAIPIYFETCLLWRQLVELSETSAAVVLHLMDKSSVPLGGARVTAEYRYISLDRYSVRKSLESTTDARGTAVMILSFPDMDTDPQRTHVDFQGHVEFEGGRQNFSERIHVRPRWAPDPEGPFRCEGDPDMVVHPMGSTAHLEYTAYWDGGVLANEAIDVVVWDNRSVRWSGNVSTDLEGRFALDVPVPRDMDEPNDRRIMINLWAQHDGSWGLWKDDISTGWWSWFGYVRDNPDPGISIEKGPFEAGEPLDLTVECELADGLMETAMAIWLPRPLDQWERDSHEWNGAPFLPEWRRYNNRQIASRYGEVLLEWSHDGYLGHLVFPEFLGIETSPFVAVGVASTDPEDPWALATTTGEIPLGSEANATVSIEEIPDDTPLSGNTTITGTAAGGGIVSVEVSIDGGAWTPAEGTTEWTYLLETDVMVSSMHLVSARAIVDGVPGPCSHEAFTTDMAPTISIIQPTEGQVFNTTMTLSGTAADDVQVLSVDVRWNASGWTSISTNGTWEMTFDLTDVDPGNYTFEVRSFDGTRYSDIDSVTVGVEAVEPDGEGPDEDERSSWLPYLGAGPTFGSIILVLVLLLLSRDRRLEPPV